MKSRHNIIYLRIADFLIKVILHETHQRFYYSFLSDFIITNLSGLIPIKKPHHIDFTINVYEHFRYNEIRHSYGKKTVYLTPLYTFTSPTSLTTFYSISLYQFVHILLRILQKLLTKDWGFALHASACCDRNRAYLFLALSEGGKSTTVELIRNNLKVIADDTVLIRKLGKQYYLFQTPFIEKNLEVEKSSMKYTIQKIFFIKKTTKLSVCKQLKEEPIIYPLFLQQVMSDRESFPHQTKIIFDFLRSFKNFYILNVNKSFKEISRLTQLIRS